MHHNIDTCKYSPRKKLQSLRGRLNFHDCWVCSENRGSEQNTTNAGRRKVAATTHASSDMVGLLWITLIRTFVPTVVESCIILHKRLWVHTKPSTTGHAPVSIFGTRVVLGMSRENILAPWALYSEYIVIHSIGCLKLQNLKRRMPNAVAMVDWVD
jgi:hypothetical protein